MSQIRKAHSVEIIDRRLRDCESAGGCDFLELVGIHDELARVERKWIEKAGAERSASRRRPLADAGQLNVRFERLGRLIEAALRRPAAPSPEHDLLMRAAASLKARRPLQP